MDKYINYIIAFLFFSCIGNSCVGKQSTKNGIPTIYNNLKTLNYDFNDYKNISHISRKNDETNIGPVHRGMRVAFDNNYKVNQRLSNQQINKLGAIMPPNLFCKSAILIDARNGNILFGKQHHSKRQVASTQKLLTAIVAINQGMSYKTMHVNKSDTLCEPAKLYIRAGERYQGAKLIEAMLVKSGNDVAKCIARNTSGSEKDFSMLMNYYAKNYLGLKSSYFRNASGLPDNMQYSTAYDIAMIALYSLKYPLIRESVRKKSIRFVHNNGKSKILKNTNKLLLNYPHCIGMKTGYTKASGKSLVALGQYDGKKIIAVVLGSNSKYIWSDAKNLLEWGFKIN